MSVFRLTDVADATRESKESWDKRNEKYWDKPFHGHFFDNPELIAKMDNRNFQILNRLINKASTNQESVKILECACGIGRYVERIQVFNTLATIGIDYTGIDFADKNIQEAKRLYSINTKEFKTNFLMSDMLEFQTKEKFSVIFMVSAMSSIEQKSKEVIDHLNTMLTPEGVIAIFEQRTYCIIDNIGIPK